jgi:hypothetical protein
VFGALYHSHFKYFFIVNEAKKNIKEKYMTVTEPNKATHLQATQLQMTYQL